ADLAEGLDEARRARRQHDVAGQRDVGPRARGNAVDGADDRLRQAAQAPDQRIVPGFERVPRGRAAAPAVPPQGQVLAGARAAARAGQEHGADLGIALGVLERRLQLAVEIRRERIELLRPIERQRRDAGRLDVKTVFAQGCTLPPRSPRSFLPITASAMGRRGSSAQLLPLLLPVPEARGRASCPTASWGRSLVMWAKFRAISSIIRSRWVTGRMPSSPIPS